MYIVTLRALVGTDSSEEFLGFMIQGRIVADNSPVGTWQVQASNARSLCNGEVSYSYNYIKHHEML